MTSWVEFFAVMTDDISRLDKCCVVQNNIDRHIRPKKGEIPEISDDPEEKLGTDWILPKIIGSGIGYPSGTGDNKSEGYQLW